MPPDATTWLMTRSNLCGDTAGSHLKGPCFCISQCHSPPRNPMAVAAFSLFWGRANQPLDIHTTTDTYQLKAVSQHDLFLRHRQILGWHRCLCHEWPGELGWWELQLTTRLEGAGSVSESDFCSICASCRDLPYSKPGMELLHSPVSQNRAEGRTAACRTVLGPITHCPPP